MYALVSGEFSRNFSIDSRQGIITPTTPLDYEALPISQGHKETSVRPLRLTVRARDMGSPSLSSDAPLIIYLKDINDNTPAFERTLYKRSIPEDLPGGTSVVQVPYCFIPIKLRYEIKFVINVSLSYRLKHGIRICPRPTTN